jgi:hypothetical protein
MTVATCSFNEYEKENPVTKRVSITSLVLSFPLDMPAKNVVEKLKQKGLVVKPGYVYEIRSSAKRRKRKEKVGFARPLKAGPTRHLPSVMQAIADEVTGRRARIARGNGGSGSRVESDSEGAEFCKLVVRMGLTRARVLMQHVERWAAHGLWSDNAG